MYVQVLEFGVCTGTMIPQMIPPTIRDRTILDVFFPYTNYMPTMKKLEVKKELELALVCLDKR